MWFVVFFLCNTVAITSKRAEGRFFVRKNAPCSVQEECGCTRSLILEQNGNADETNTKVQQFQYVKSREFTSTMFTELTTRTTHMGFLVCIGGPLWEMRFVMLMSL